MRGSNPRIKRGEGRGTQALRQLRLLRLLIGEWWSVRELCDELYGGSYRTAYRDLEQLIDHGVPIETREATEGSVTWLEYRLRWARFASWMRAKPAAQRRR